jgi:hypothetical protein
MLKRWDGFMSFLDDGRISRANNATERALRGFSLAENPSCLRAPIVALTANFAATNIDEILLISGQGVGGIHRE